MKGARHRDGQPESLVDAFGFRVHIDRHAGTVIEGTGPDGQPYRVVQTDDYGYLDGVNGDDGEGYDVYLGLDHKADRVFVVTQVKASTGAYDEQKAMLGYPTKRAAEDTYKAHTHPSMFGRIGCVTLPAFRAQVKAHLDSGAAVFRVETDEDGEDLACLEEYEAGPLSEPEPPSEPAPSTEKP